MEKRKFVLGQDNKGVKKLLNSIDVRAEAAKYKESISTMSKNLTNNLIKSVEKTPQQFTELINSIKKNKLKNLEKLLRVDKTQRIVSNRKNYIYRSDAGKMTIIDRDMWGEPYNVTIKENNNVIIKCIKFWGDQPFIYPLFNEKEVKGKIIFMDENEIWYQDKTLVNVVTFKGSACKIYNISIDRFVSNTQNVKIDTFKSLEKDLLFNYIRNYVAVHRRKKLLELVKENNIPIEKIVKVREKYIATKIGNNNFKVTMFDEDYTITEELQVKKLPPLRDEGLDILFTKDILDYIRSNNYVLEDFKQNGDYIEYWQQIGEKNICVMRYEV